MKKTLLALMIAALAAGCTGRTEHGECVGFAEDKDPALQYELHTWNVIAAGLLFETFLIPLFVVLDRHSCPVGVKGEPNA